MRLDDRWTIRHRAWLAKLGLLDRPWMILGGAPNPTLPPELLATHARVDINNSGLTAMRMSLPAADLSIRREALPWRVHPTFATRGLIYVSFKPTLLLRLRLMRKRRARVDSMIRLPGDERDALISEFVGEELASVGDLGKASNGIFAACYGLRFDIPEIVLTGVSVSQDGHSYDTLQRKRKQVAEDLFALEKLRHDRRIATTEAALAEQTGIRLWTPPSSSLAGGGR